MTDVKKMSLLWDQRYSAEEYAYGKEANVFFSSQLTDMAPGLILLPGEGEGRNAVHAAREGWTVEAFDQSNVGRSKALALASALGIEISYRVCELRDFIFLQNQYDAIALLFFHADPDSRLYLHRKVSEALKPGGKLILEGFHKEQLNNDTGGPKSLDMLFDEQTLASDFALLDTHLIERREVVLNEGPYHQGAAEIIRYSGTKPK